VRAIAFYDRRLEIALPAGVAHPRRHVFDDGQQFITSAVVHYYAPLDDRSPAEVALVVTLAHGVLRRRNPMSHYSGRRLGS